jgi:myo-inositol-1-phosphate synthase
MRGCWSRNCCEQVKPGLQKVKPMKAVFDKKYVKRIDGPNVKVKGSLMDKAEALMDDMKQFQKANGWTGW